MALSSQRKSRDKRKSSAGQETREEWARKDAASRRSSAPAASRLSSAPRKQSAASERTGITLGAGAPQPVPPSARPGRSPRGHAAL